MSSQQLLHLPSVGEQICYVQCGFCATVLLVSVPCSSMKMVVTVRCGHCSSLLSVNMLKASFLPTCFCPSEESPHDRLDREQKEDDDDDDDHKKVVSQHSTSSRESPPGLVTSDDNEEDDPGRKINKPPEKRQRAPSAYNRFIKAEIKRLKAENPSMAHKEAFSMAAKNWALNPPVQFIDEIRLGNTDHHEELPKSPWNNILEELEHHDDDQIFR